MARFPAALPATPHLEPLSVDPWVASSLLQKAIRRGDSDLAAQAALTFYLYRGKAIWRKFVVIAFEDIGIGDPEILIEAVALDSDPGLRASLGGEREVAISMAR